MSIDDISRSVTKLRILKKIKKSVRLINCIKGKKSLGFFLMFVVASTLHRKVVHKIAVTVVKLWEKTTHNF